MPGSGLPCSPTKPSAVVLDRIIAAETAGLCARGDRSQPGPGSVTLYEVYAGLAKLIRREQWHDTYANGLWWVIPAA